MTNVMACIDGSNTTHAVCDYAAWASLQLSAPLTLLHVLDKIATPSSPNLAGNIGLGSREALLKELTELDEKRGKLALEHGHLILNEAKQHVQQAGVKQVVTRQRHGDLVDTLIALEHDTRLLVMGRQGTEGDSLGEHIGNNIERVVRTMHRPILVTPQTYKPPLSFMMAYDGSATTIKGVEMVATSPLLKGLSCHVVMVNQASPEVTQSLHWAQQTLSDAGFNVTSALLTGEVKPALCQYQADHQIDLFIMGAYGHSKIRQFLVGSTTTKMMQHLAHVPLLLLR